jgi:hypothetical protein
MDRQAMAARLFTSADNGRFARTFVNRIWDRLFGRGIVPAVDDMDGQPFDADLLDWLASDFADHHYDIQFLIERIMTSDAYQLPSVPKPERASADYVFRGPHPRRLTAEQFADAIASITGGRSCAIPNPNPAFRPRVALKSTHDARHRTRFATGLHRRAKPAAAGLEVMNGAFATTCIAARRMLGELRGRGESLRQRRLDLNPRYGVFDIDISESTPLSLDGRCGHLRSLAAGGGLGERGTRRTRRSGAPPSGRREVAEGSAAFQNQKQPIEAFAARFARGLRHCRQGFAFARRWARHELLSVRRPRQSPHILVKSRTQRLVRVPGVRCRSPRGAIRRTNSLHLLPYALLRDPLPKERRSQANFSAGRPQTFERWPRRICWSIFLPEFQYVRWDQA